LLKAAVSYRIGEDDDSHQQERDSTAQYRADDSMPVSHMCLWDVARGAKCLVGCGLVSGWGVAGRLFRDLGCVAGRGAAQ